MGQDSEGPWRVGTMACGDSGEDVVATLIRVCPQTSQDHPGKGNQTSSSPKQMAEASGRQISARLKEPLLYLEFLGEGPFCLRKGELSDSEKDQASHFPGSFLRAGLPRDALVLCAGHSPQA